MKQVILIHGLPDEKEVREDVCPSPSNSHWFPWIQKQLTRKDLVCQTPEMPRSYNPNYNDHERVMNQIDISNETTLVGHSCGGGFLLRYLSDHKNIVPKKVIIVAPWLDLEKHLQELNPKSEYFDFTVDQKLTERTNLVCIYSTDDNKCILDTVEYIKKELPNADFLAFSDKGHFTEPDLGSKEFPELLAEILK